MKTYCKKLIGPVFFFVTLAVATVGRGELLVKDGQRVVFMGDNTTAQGWAHLGGYVKLVTAGLAEAGVKITPLPLGANDQRVTDMARRLDADALALKPEWLALSCGASEVRLGAKGVALEQFRLSVSDILERAAASGVKVLLLTALPLGEDADSADNQRLAAYNEVLRELAKSRQLPLADVNAAAWAALKKTPPVAGTPELTADGAVLNPSGHLLVAASCLRALGMTEPAVAQAERQWTENLSVPCLASYADFWPTPHEFGIPLWQWRELDRQAVKAGSDSRMMSVTLYMRSLATVLTRHDTPALNLAQVVAETRAQLLGDVARLTAGAASTAAAVAPVTPVGSPPLLVKSGEKVAFMGDSITAMGADALGGYVNLMIDGLKRAGAEIVPITDGFGGSKSSDMAARLDANVLAKRPDWLTLSCGVNDVWHWSLPNRKGVTLEEYRQNVSDIIDRARARGVKVLLLTPTPVGEDPAVENNVKLAAYVAAMREVAAEKGVPLADMNAAMTLALKEYPAKPLSRYLTVDGVHMNSGGNVVMAREGLRGFGVPAAALERIAAEWQREPVAFFVGWSLWPVPGEYGIPFAHYVALHTRARALGVTENELALTLYLRAWGEVIAAHADAQVFDMDAMRKEAQTLLRERIAALVK